MVRVGVRVSVPHARTVPSLEAETTREPSGEKCTSLTYLARVRVRVRGRRPHLLRDDRAQLRRLGGEDLEGAI